MPRQTSLGDLLEDAALAGTIQVVSGDAAGGRITGITEDSRLVGDGTMFVARPGTAHDGSDHVADAIERGAAAVLAVPAVATGVPASVVGVATPDPATIGGDLAFRFHGHPERRMGFAGITGTNGKTTVATLARQLLEATLGRCGLIGTIEAHDGVESTPATLTTPGRIALAGVLGDFAEAGCERVVMEVSSHALDQGRVTGIDFDVAVFTNLSGDHLDYHGDMASYAAAKALLFAGLRTDATAIVNLADPASRTMIEAGPARVIGVVPARADAETPEGVRGLEHRIIDRDFSGMTLELRFDGTSHRVRVPLVGDHNAFNVAAAAAMAFSFNADWSAIVAALETIEAPRGRLQPVHGPADEVRVFVDYAHTDDAIVNVLAGVRPEVPPDAALIIVFGAGGDRDRTKRPRMMRAALDGADRVVVTSDNPRTEPPEAIVAEIVAACDAGRLDRIHPEVDRSLAIDHAIATADPGDVIVIAGKGHEDYQIVGTERRHFDDVEVAAAALARRRGEAAL